MGTKALLSNIINNCCYYRGLLKNRILVAFQQPNFNLKSVAKDKLKELNIPEAPKKPLTSYFRFLAERRPLLKKQNPSLKPIDLTKQCAQDWNNLDPIIRHKYEEAYHKELEIYYEKLHSFSALLSPQQAEALSNARKEKQEDKHKRTLKKLQRESDKPKRPTSNFGYFIKEKFELPENKNKKFVDILKGYKDEWGNLTDEQRGKYNKLHEDDKIRYLNDMEKWETKMIKAGKSDIIRKDSQIPSAKPKVSHTKSKKHEHDHAK